MVRTPRRRSARLCEAPTQFSGDHYPATTTVSWQTDTGEVAPSASRWNGRLVVIWDNEAAPDACMNRPFVAARGWAL
jgi:hypothetical protein